MVVGVLTCSPLHHSICVAQMNTQCSLIKKLCITKTASELSSGCLFSKYQFFSLKQFLSVKLVEDLKASNSKKWIYIFHHLKSFLLTSVYLFPLHVTIMTQSCRIHQQHLCRGVRLPQQVSWISIGQIELFDI